jgi:hypothetical protein
VAEPCGWFVWMDIEGYDLAHQGLKHKISHFVILGSVAENDLVFWSERTPQSSVVKFAPTVPHSPQPRRSVSNERNGR